jgi:hypothetical protein
MIVSIPIIPPKIQVASLNAFAILAGTPTPSVSVSVNTVGAKGNDGPTGLQGPQGDLSPLGNYDTDWAQRFQIAYNN